MKRVTEPHEDAAATEGKLVELPAAADAQPLAAVAALYPTPPTEQAAAAVAQGQLCG